MMIPELKEGEIYVGLVGDNKGNAHHVILLPGDNDEAAWEAQMEWAKSIGGDLPTRIEQSMLWATHRDQFKQDCSCRPQIAHLIIQSFRGRHDHSHA